MYCGNNKTALQSQRQISEAMMTLLQKKTFSQISISELCKAAGISRQTFYSLFTSRENVMVFTLQVRYCDAPEIALPQPEAGEGDLLEFLCRGYSEYMLRNRALIKLLVDNRIDYLLYDSFFEAMDSCDCFLSGQDPCTRSYAASFYAGGIASVARRYAQEGCMSSADQLQQLLMTLLCGRLFR
ncbi:MAG: TetR/AcrR family transcriptional regulator [Clostridia bacterium]|nr:TetR/AcrR family transcriptional regulator [Clostridia bacterium]